MGGRRAHFLLALSNLTIDHAFLSRRRTVPTLNRHLQHLGALHIFSMHCINISSCLPCLLPVLRSVATTYISQDSDRFVVTTKRIKNFSMSHSSIFLISAGGGEGGGIMSRVAGPGIRTQRKGNMPTTSKPANGKAGRKTGSIRPYRTSIHI